MMNTNMQEIEELTERFSSRHHGSRGGVREGGSDFGFMEPFHDPSSGIIDAFEAFLQQRMTGRNLSSDMRSRSDMIPEHNMAFGPGPWLIFRGQPPVHMINSDGFEALFNGSQMGHQRANYGDFLMGPGLRELIERLSVNDRQGPPPAPRSAIDSMPSIVINHRHLSTDSHCPVCQDKFELGSEAKQMPCNHIYHSDCIVPWLVQHNSCPVCRVELPSVASGSAHSTWHPGTANSSVGDGSNNGQSQGRRNPFSYFWPFRSSNQNTDRFRET